MFRCIALAARRNSVQLGGRWIPSIAVGYNNNGTDDFAVTSRVPSSACRKGRASGASHDHGFDGAEVRRLQKPRAVSESPTTWRERV